MQFKKTGGSAACERLQTLGGRYGNYGTINNKKSYVSFSRCARSTEAWSHEPLGMLGPRVEDKLENCSAPEPQLLSAGVEAERPVRHSGTCGRGNVRDAFQKSSADSHCLIPRTALVGSTSKDDWPANAFRVRVDLSESFVRWARNMDSNLRNCSSRTRASAARRSEREARRRPKPSFAQSSFSSEDGMLILCSRASKRCSRSDNRRSASGRGRVSSCTWFCF